MLFFQKVDIEVMPTRDDPLYVGHFFELEGMWWKKRRQRQELIYSVAVTWARLVKRQISAPGMLIEELMMTQLTNKVRDARVIVEKFFKINKLGFNLGDGNHSLSSVSPRKLPRAYMDSVDRLIKKVVYNPGLPPTTKYFVKSMVSVRLDQFASIKKKLHIERRDDLLPMVVWLFEQVGPIPFYFRPAGKLQARDTSMWPIKAIETWPGWLRKDLFGTTADIENAFCQFILSHLEAKHAGKQQLLLLKYPDIVKAAYNKKEFREMICRDVLLLPPHKDNINVVKKLIMALANGSNASAGLMTSDSRSQAVKIVKQYSPDLMPSQQIRAGDRLSHIAKQFRNAKRELCIYLFKEPPTRDNQKKIFQEYFKWEKDARYKIWEMAGYTGVNAHDGLDGINIPNPSEFSAEVLKKYQLRIQVENYEHDPTL